MVQFTSRLVIIGSTALLGGDDWIAAAYFAIAPIGIVKSDQHRFQNRNAFHRRISN